MRRGRSARLMQLVGRAAGRNFLLRRPLRPATLPAASTRLSSIFGVRHRCAKPGVSISYRHHHPCGLPFGLRAKALLNGLTHPQGQRPRTPYHLCDCVTVPAACRSPPGWPADASASALTRPCRASCLRYASLAGPPASLHAPWSLSQVDAAGWTKSINTALICRLPPPLCLRPAARLRAGKLMPQLRRGITLPALRHRLSAVKALRRGPNSPPRWGCASWALGAGPHFPAPSA